MSSHFGQIRPLLTAACRNAIRCARRRTIWHPQFSTNNFNRSRSEQTSPGTTRIPSAEDGSSKQNGQDHANQMKPPQIKSLRPLTLLLLCIPLGYVLRWSTSSSQTSTNGFTTSDGFTKYQLVKREDISPTLAIFTLAPPAPEAALDISGEDRKDAAVAGIKVQSVQVKQPLLQIARDYTILPSLSPHEDEEEGILRLLIRREDRGEMSGYLFQLGIGSELQVRGPNMEFGITSSHSNEHEANSVGKIVFLAGGAGIATALALLGSMARYEEPGETDVRLLWASRRREECLGGGCGKAEGEQQRSWMRWLWAGQSAQKNEITRAPTANEQGKGEIVRQLEMLKSLLESRSGSSNGNSNNLRVDCYVDEEGTFIRPSEVAAIAATANSSPNDGTKLKLIFVSGPEGFVEYWAGPKAWVGGRETQGPLRGALAGMDLRGWDVIKL